MPKVKSYVSAYSVETFFMANRPIESSEGECCLTFYIMEQAHNLYRINELIEKVVGALSLHWKSLTYRFIKSIHNESN